MHRSYDEDLQKSNKAVDRGHEHSSFKKNKDDKPGGRHRRGDESNDLGYDSHDHIDEPKEIRQRSRVGEDSSHFMQGRDDRPPRRRDENYNRKDNYGADEHKTFEVSSAHHNRGDYDRRSNDPSDHNSYRYSTDEIKKDRDGKRSDAGRGSRRYDSERRSGQISKDRGIEQERTEKRRDESSRDRAPNDRTGNRDRHPYGSHQKDANPFDSHHGLGSDKPGSGNRRNDNTREKDFGGNNYDNRNDNARDNDFGGNNYDTRNDNARDNDFGGNNYYNRNDNARDNDFGGNNYDTRNDNARDNDFGGNNYYNRNYSRNDNGYNNSRAKDIGGYKNDNSRAKDIGGYKNDKWDDTSRAKDYGENNYEYRNDNARDNVYGGNNYEYRNDNARDNVYGGNNYDDGYNNSRAKDKGGNNFDGWKDKAPAEDNGGFDTFNDNTRNKENGENTFDSLNEPKGINDGDMIELANKLTAIAAEIDDHGSIITFQKDFYMEHPGVTAMTEEQVDDLRRTKNIHIVSGENVPRPVGTIDLASFPEWVTNAFHEEKLTIPTPIQMQGWPIALSGRDAYGIAETGSGKTLAFVLPAFVHISAQPPVDKSRGDGPIVLIISPTRELALQIKQECDRFSKHCKAAKATNGDTLMLRALCAYGGDGRTNELGYQLSGSTEILIGCPGRLMDLLNRRLLKLTRITYFVLDEADRLLSMGFEAQVDAINRCIRKDRQTSMWSATWPPEVEDMARRFCREEPAHVNVGARGVKILSNILQAFEHMANYGEKIKRLQRLLLENIDYRFLIFVGTKRLCETVNRDLRGSGIRSVVLTGDKLQSERQQAITEFKQGRHQVLICTDVLQRGIDINNVYGVVNFDMPKSLDEYVHRIGRCGRAGKKGKAYSFYGQYEDVELCKKIKAAIGDCNLNAADVSENLEEAAGDNENQEQGQIGWDDAPAGGGSAWNAPLTTVWDDDAPAAAGTWDTKPGGGWDD